MTTLTPNLFADRFGLLLAQTNCHHCQGPTPTVAVWVPAFHAIDEEGHPQEGEGAVLRYIEWLDRPVLEQVAGRAPWLRVAPTRTSGRSYLAHHCTTCGALQGDHYVHSPDGPYFPQDNVELGRVLFVEGAGSLRARADVGESAWMDQVEQACRRE